MTGKSIRILTVILAFLGVLFVVQPAALADQLTLTSAGSTVVGDVLVDPYIATINGVAGQKVICDDFADDTYLQETWTANVSDLAQLSNTSNLRFNVGLTDYEEAAWLAEQLLLPANSAASAQIEISFAIWNVFDSPAAQNYLTANDPSLVAGFNVWQGLAANAASLPLSDFSNILIYTPAGTPKGYSGPPQEFIVVTPEASSLANLAVDLLSLAGAVFFVRRRRLPSGLSN